LYQCSIPRTLEKAIGDFITTENQLGYHHKYAQAALGLALMDKKGKKMDTTTKQAVHAQTTAMMRNLLVHVCLDPTFTLLFDVSEGCREGFS